MNGSTTGQPTARRILRRLLNEQRRELVPGILGGVLWQTAGILVPLVIGWVIDDGIEADRSSVVWLGAAAITAIGVVEVIGASLRHRAACRSEEYGKVALRDALVAAAVADERSDAAELSAGELIGRATGDVDELGSFLDSVSHTAAHLVAVPAVVIVLAVIDWPLAVVTTLVMALLGLAMWRYSAIWGVRSAEVRDAFDASTAASEELVEGFRVAAGLGVGHVMAERCAERSGELRRASVRRARLWIVFEPVVEGLSLIAVTVVVWLGGLRVIDGHLSIGGLVTAVGLALFLVWPVRTLGERIVTVQMALASAQRVAGLLAAPVDGIDASHLEARPPSAATPAGVMLAGVRVERHGVVALHGVSLELRPGTFAVLSGEVGSGKSTLLATIGGELTPTAGSVILGGVAMASWPAGARRRTVLRVGPAPFIFAGTVAENVRFGAPGATDGDIRSALAVAGALEFVDALPHGVDTVIGERGVNLSGGQRQRLGVARAVAARPEVLLLDAATSAVDPDLEFAILASIRAAWRDRVVVAVSNHPEAETLADITLVLADTAVELR
jgi:ABC-type multidrug transport system fused ATPase/permease subunit